MEHNLTLTNDNPMYESINFEQVFKFLIDNYGFELVSSNPNGITNDGYYFYTNSSKRLQINIWHGFELILECCIIKRKFLFSNDKISLPRDCEKISNGKIKPSDFKGFLQNEKFYERYFELNTPTSRQYNYIEKEYYINFEENKANDTALYIELLKIFLDEIEYSQNEKMKETKIILIPWFGIKLEEFSFLEDNYNFKLFSCYLGGRKDDDYIIYKQIDGKLKVIMWLEHNLIISCCIIKKRLFRKNIEINLREESEKISNGKIKPKDFKGYFQNKDFHARWSELNHQANSESVSVEEEYYISLENKANDTSLYIELLKMYLDNIEK